MEPLCEPVETLVMDVPEAAVGSCIEKLGTRKGEMQNMEKRAPMVDSAGIHRAVPWPDRLPR